MPDLTAALNDLQAIGQHRFIEQRDAARFFQREIAAAMDRSEGEIELRLIGPDWNYVFIDHHHPNAPMIAEG